MTRLRFLFAAALLGCASAATAQPAPPPAATAADSERLAKAMELARTVQPRDLLFQQSMAVIDKQALDGLLAEDSVKAMERENPGIVRAMWTAARPILAESVDKSMPDLWDRLSKVYARHFTPAQLDEMLRFFRSPLGQKFLVAMHSSADVRPMLRDVLRPGDGKVSEGSYMQTVTGAALGAAKAMTPAEAAEFERFFATRVGKKMVEAGPDVSRTMLEWTNRPDPEMDARIQQAMLEAAQKFLEGDKSALNGPPSTRGGE